VPTFHQFTMAKDADDDDEWWSRPKYEHQPQVPEFEGQRMITGICFAHRRAACKDPLCVSVPNETKDEQIERLATELARANERKAVFEARKEAKQAKQAKPSQAPDTMADDAKPSQAPDTMADDDERKAAVEARKVKFNEARKVTPDTMADDDERKAVFEARKVKFNEARKAKLEPKQVETQELRQQVLRQQEDACSTTLLRPKAAAAAPPSAVSAVPSVISASNARINTDGRATTRISLQPVSAAAPPSAVSVKKVKKAVAQNAAEDAGATAQPGASTAPTASASAPPAGQQAATSWGLMQADFDGRPMGKKYLVVSKGEQVYLHSMMPGSLTYAMGQVSRQGAWDQGMFPISHWRPLSESDEDRLATLYKESGMQAHQDGHKDEAKREMVKEETPDTAAVGSASSSSQIGQVIPGWAAWGRQRTVVKQEAKDEATPVLEGDSDDDQWGSWGPGHPKAVVKREMVKEEKPDTAAVGSAPQVVPARSSTGHAWQWYDNDWHYDRTW
jgi:hypothetical protein